MNRFLPVLLLMAVLLCCKSKKKDEKKDFFSIIPVLQGQVKAMDSSLQRIIAIRTENNRSDTIDVHRDEFRTYARDFLSLPDITKGDRKDSFDESVMFDEPTRSILLNYTTTDPDEEIRRETVVLEADENSNGEVKTIIVDWFKEYDDSTVIRNMVWQMDKEFKVITKTTPVNQEEKVRILHVKWE